jgi:O-ureido-D-serine cyclo-ligase
MTSLHNDARAVRWNSHKKYLGELANRGVPVIPTIFADVGTQLDFGAVAASIGVEALVVKPAVSANAHETRRFDLDARREGQLHLDRLLAERDVMIQPHVSGLVERGELSLLFVRGTFSHAIRRRSALVDSGSMAKSAAAEASDAARERAAQVLAAASASTGVEPHELLYARVDLAEVALNEFVLLELELIEPSLFFAHAPAAAERFAAAVTGKQAVREV